MIGLILWVLLAAVVGLCLEGKKELSAEGSRERAEEQRSRRSPL